VGESGRIRLKIDHQAMVEIAEINFSVLPARLKPCHPAGIFLGHQCSRQWKMRKTHHKGHKGSQRKSSGKLACNAGPSTVLSFRSRNENFAQEDNALKLAARRRRKV
jgi:hypothetical protein